MPSPTQAVAAASSDQPHPPTCQTLVCSGCKRGTIPAQMETCGSYGRGATCWNSRNNPVNLLRYHTSLMLETVIQLGAQSGQWGSRKTLCVVYSIVSVSTTCSRYTPTD